MTRADSERHGLAVGDTRLVALGRWQERVVIAPSGEAASSFSPSSRCPRVPLDRLGLHIDSTGVVRLGPLLGILVLYKMTRRGPRGSQMETYAEIMQQARKAGVMAFIVRPTAFNRGRDRISGLTYANGRWQAANFPLPDVIYNRIPSRGVESRLRAQGLFRAFERLGIAYYNPHYLDKWSVHRALCNDSAVGPHMPETRRLRSTRDVSALLSRYGRAFLKPSGGSLGLGAMLVTRHSDGRLRYRMNTMRGTSKNGVLPHLSMLPAVLPRRNDYLAQQAIDLARFRGRVFDVRGLVQRDGDNEWVLTGAAARVAGRGRITTHVPRGGSRMPLRPLLHDVFGEAGAEEISRTIKAVSVQASQALQRSSERPFGELSLDLAIDTRGHVWILEMNAKPFRFDERGLRRAAQARLMRYSTRLAVKRSQ